MKQNFFKYLAIAAALLVPAMNVQAQDSGVKTAKTVKGPDDNGFYTIRLETFATGTTTVTENISPIDMVLVLDVSGSMAWPKGNTTRQYMSLTYNMVNNGDQDYFIEYNGYTEQIFASYENNRYYLYVSPDSQSRVYLTDTGTTTRRRDASYSDRPNGEIVERNVYVGTSRMTALKNAIAGENGFIDQINEKDIKKDDAGNPTGDRVGHRISIIKFASDKRTVVGDDSYNTTTQYVNYTQTINHFLPVNGNVQTLKDHITALIPRGSTQAGYGMELANDELVNVIDGHSKVVIFFTDGLPEDDYAAIEKAQTTKNDLGAVVYSIGVFDETPSPGNNPPTSGSTTWRYMNYVSSNYPNASGINSAGSDGDYTAGYYQDASSQSADLTAIFTSIADGMGGATAEIGSSTQVRDVVSNSFVIPEGTQPSDIKVFTADALTETTWADSVAFNATVNIVDVDKDGKPVEEGDVNATNRAVIVEGFDFSKDDTSEGAGDGNWVGQRFNRNHNPQYFWAGKKLIIEIKIKANGEATGGTGTPTNEATSGVYIKDPETGDYTCIDYYDIPHTTLSTTIKIKKTGLRSGESATFEIMKIRPKGWDDTKTQEENVANIEYNIIGQPLPNSHEYTGSETLEGSDLYKEMGWSSFSKVILTNKSETNGAEVIKVMRGLDPYWIYMVLEDDWGWAYDMTGHNQADADGLTTTSSVAVNPFTFENKEKVNAVKHAEAVTINHFGGNGNTSREEHYKSSKTSFPTTH